MGILNLTPDSFSDGGLYFEADAAARRARQLVDEGADILDVGACSTAPGKAPASPDEECDRLRRLLQTRMKALASDPDRRRKLLRFALSRGYSYDEVSEILQELTQENQD